MNLFCQHGVQVRRMFFLKYSLWMSKKMGLKRICSSLPSLGDFGGGKGERDSRLMHYTYIENFSQNDVEGDQLQGLFTIRNVLDAGFPRGQYVKEHTLQQFSPFFTRRCHQQINPEAYADICVYSKHTVFEKDLSFAKLYRKDNRSKKTALIQFANDVCRSQYFYHLPFQYMNDRKEFLEQILEFKNDYTASEFCSMMSALAFCRNNYRFVDIREHLERLYKYCCNQSEMFKDEELFRCCDAWCIMRLKPKYLLQCLLERIMANPEKLTRERLIQVIYLIGECRMKCKEFIDHIQGDLLKFLCLEHSTVTELGAVCAAFYVSQNHVASDDFIKTLETKLLSCNLHQEQSYYILCCLKMYKKVYKIDMKFMEEFCSSLVPVVESYRGYPILSLLSFLGKVHFFHEPLLEECCKQLYSKPVFWRTKDVSKLLFSLATLQFYPSNFDQLVRSCVSELVKAKNTFYEFPVSLTACLLSLAFLNLYPKDLLDYAFSPHFLEGVKAFEKRERKDIRKDYFVLEMAYRLECLEGSNNSIIDRSYLLGRPFPHFLSTSLEEDLRSSRHVKFIVRHLEDLLGGVEFCKLRYVLPITKMFDIEFRTNSKNELIPFNNDDGVTSTTQSMIDVEQITSRLGGSNSAMNRSKELHSEDDAFVNRHKHLLTVPPKLHLKNGEKRYLIQPWSRNSFSVGGKSLLGYCVLKKRLLQHLGYHVIEIKFWDYVEAKDQRKFIQELLQPYIRGSTSR